MSGTPVYLLPWYLRIPVAFRLATNYWTPIKDARAAWVRWKVTSPYPGRLRAAWHILLGRPPEPAPGSPPLYPRPPSVWYPWIPGGTWDPLPSTKPPEKDPT